MPTSTDIALVLDGFRFPATRRDLYVYAREQQAPPDIVQALRDAPDRVYASIDDLFDAMPEVTE